MEIPMRDARRRWISSRRFGLRCGLVILVLVTVRSALWWGEAADKGRVQRRVGVMAECNP